MPFTFIILKYLGEAGIIILIFHLKKLKSRKVNLLTYNHIANKWQSQSLGSDFQPPKLKLFHDVRANNVGHI